MRMNEYIDDFIIYKKSLGNLNLGLLPERATGVVTILRRRIRNGIGPIHKYSLHVIVYGIGRFHVGAPASNYSCDSGLAGSDSPFFSFLSDSSAGFVSFSDLSC